MPIMTTSALDQGLQLADPNGPVEFASAAPQGAAPAAAAPAAKPAGTAQPAGLGGAVGQAMQIMGAARQATAADPMTARATEAIDKDETARSAAADSVQQNMDQIRKLQAQPDLPRPEVPHLSAMPTPPTVEHKDPLRVFGQFLPVIAALGALTTRTPAVAALNAATAMVNAGKANDKLEEEKQRQSWIDNTKAAVDNNTSLLDQYKLALEDHNMTVTERMAKVNSLAALNKDAVTLAALRGGNLDSLTKFLDIQTKATSELANLTSHLSQQQLERDRLQNQELYQAAELEISRRKAQNVSMGDAIGPVLLKIQQAGTLGADGQPKPLDQILTPGERQALAVYMRLNSNGGYSDNPTAAAAGGGGLGGLMSGGPGAAPAAAPAAPAAPASPPPAPANTTPPVSMLKEGFVTKFDGGRGSWTLRNGKPVKVG